MGKLDRLEQVEIRSTGELRDWLAANHGQKDSVWLITYKKVRPDLYVSYDEIVDQVLCFGWIDSLPRKLDEARTMVLLSPRKPGSAWSAVNKAKVARLEAAGRIAPSGFAAIDRAKANGAWVFLDDVEALIEPEDLKQALDGMPAARRNFDGFSRSSRRGMLEWIKRAKRAETRTARIETIVVMAARGEKARG